MSASFPSPKATSAPQTAGKEAFPEESAKVWTLIAAGDSRQAVDVAKRVHERWKDAASEALLIDAYGARISALFNRQLAVEAKALMDLVRERYPASRERLRPLTALFVAGRVDLDPLIQPLSDPFLPPEKQAAIYRSIRLHVTDLGALAKSCALPPEHPLRVSAAALVKGFEDVTSGPVHDSALAFSEISRQNPLAPWKMLLRSIAAFYRRDDELCRKCLAAIEGDSAAARLAPALRALMGEKSELTPAAVSLVTQVGQNLEGLRSRLQKLDHLLHRGDPGPILKEIRKTVAECRQSCPDLLESLRQHISVRADVEGLDQPRVNSAMGGPPLADAHFWKLMARSMEPNRWTIFFACTLWEEFRKHALRENLFPSKGPEIAALYLHMASLLNRLPHDSLPSQRREYAGSFPGLAGFYSDQPAEIRALARAKDKADFSYLDPSALLERACEAHPCADNFRQWWDRTRSETAAMLWRVAFPDDVRPLLHLMESAERSRALQKAFKFMKQAEDLDGLNPVVRKARLRLLVSITVDHLRRSKARQAELDLADLEALPQAQQGDRSAFVAALRWVSCVKWGSEAEVLRARDDVTRLLNSALAAELVLSGVAGLCKLHRPAAEPALPPDAEPLIFAVSRACLLAEDMDFRAEIPQNVSTLLISELHAKAAVPGADALAAVGEAAWRATNLALAYAVSVAGLASNPAGHAGFLFLRARVLLSLDPARHDACLAAASELARRDRDQDLLDTIGKWREQLDIDSFDPMVDLGSGLSAEEINRILGRERKQHALPAAKAVNKRKRRECDCPVCRMERGQMPREIEEMAEKYGPDAVAQALEEVLDGGARRQRGKRRGGPEREFNDFDIFRERL